MQIRTNEITASSGFSILEVMIAVGILSVASYFVVSLLHSSLKGSVQTNVTVQAENIKRNLVNNFTNDPSWINTLTATQNLSCLLPLYSGGAASCPAGDYTNIVLVKDGGPSPGGLLYDSSNASNGFDSNGFKCSGFTSAGNDKCPFRVDITVSLSCPAGCDDPQVRIIGDMKYAPVNPAFKASFNPSKYHFDFIRSQEASSLQSSCDMLDGVYDSGPPAKCRIAVVPSGAVIAVDSASCPPGFSTFTPAAGRVLEGAGAGGTTTYNVGDSGGSDSHTLTLDELPNHTHDVPEIVTDVAIFGSGGRGGYAAGSPFRSMGATGGLTNGGLPQPYGSQPDGSAAPIDIRQAYYPLLYCQKN